MKTELDFEQEEIGRRVRLARLGRGMTKEALAEAADTSPQFLSQIEKGEQSMTMLKFKRLTAALGVSSDYLLFGREGLAAETALAMEYLAGLTPAERELVLGMVLHLRDLLDKAAPAQEPEAESILPPKERGQSGRK